MRRRDSGRTVHTETTMWANKSAYGSSWILKDTQLQIREAEVSAWPILQAPNPIGWSKRQSGICMYSKIWYQKKSPEFMECTTFTACSKQALALPTGGPSITQDFTMHPWGYIASLFRIIVGALLFYTGIQVQGDWNYYLQYIWKLLCMYARLGSQVFRTRNI